MSGRPPALAERIAGASLAPCDRQAVMGDLEEEFAALEVRAGRAAANRWYWAQTATSLAPNLVRRFRHAWLVQRPEANSAEARRQRRMRQLGVGLLGLALVGFAAARSVHRDDSDVRALAVRTVVFGLVMVGFSFFRDDNVQAESPFRFRLLSGVMSVAYLSSLFGLISHSAVGSILSGTLLVLLWPGRLQRWQRDTVYAVRTPVVDGARWAYGDVYGTTSVPAIPLGMSRPILGWARTEPVRPEDAVEGITPMRVTITRKFAPTDAIRLFALVKAPAEEVTATLEVHAGERDGVTRVRPVSVSSGALRPPRPWPSYLPRPLVKPPEDPNPSVAELDVVMPLAGLAPGPYVLRLVATNGALVTHEDTDIEVTNLDGPRVDA
jgi:hypothetical protein